MLKALSRRALFALAALGTALGLGSLEARAADPIKIGTFLAATGPASFLGDPELKTLEMYIGEINKAGGVLGRQLELVHYDTGGSAKKAQTAVKRLIKNDEVDIIVGGTLTGSTMAVIKEVERAGMPFISLAGGTVIVEPVKQWVFKTPHTDKMVCGKVFTDMETRGISKIGLMSNTGGFGKSMRKYCMKLASAYGIEIIADETYGGKDPDMTPQLTKIKNTPGVQAVLDTGFGQSAAIVTKNFKQLGFTVPLYESHGVASKKYIELAGDAANGVRLPAGALIVADKLPAGDPLKAVTMAYKSAYEGKFGAGTVSTFGGHAYDGLQIAIAAIQRAGSTDRDDVRKEIERTSGYVGTSGVVHMSDKDHLGLDLSAFKMLTIKDGDWALLAD